MAKGIERERIVRARELRKRQTKPEELLWLRLKNRQLCNLKFRRQHPILNYIVDFYCHEKRFVIELDGRSHDQRTLGYDLKRQANLEKSGLRVERFTNDEIICQIEDVLNMIIQSCGLDLDKSYGGNQRSVWR